MHRRTLPVVLAALLVAAGCLGGASPRMAGSATPGTPTTGNPQAASPTASDPSPASPQPDRGGSFPDGPKRPPEPPGTLTAETASEYARTYEYRYAYNALWSNEHTDIDLECEVRSVENTSEGYDVVVACTGHANTGGSGNGTATATVLHADWFTQVYRYRVTEGSLTGYRVSP